MKSLEREHEVILRVPPEEGYIPDRERQMDILSRLPDDILYELAGHLRTSFLESQKFAKLRGIVFTAADFDDETILRGKVFEMLVAADPALHTPDPLAEELLTLMHDPERFAMEEVLRYYRTPDGAYIEVDRVDGWLIVRAAAEAKLGRLNRRAASQLGERGFRYGLVHMATAVNETEDLATHGLVETAAYREGLESHSGELITVASDFRQVLIVPANRNTDDPASLVNSRDFDDLAFGELLYLLSDAGRLTIKKAAFSAAEVAALTRLLYQEM